MQPSGCIYLGNQMAAFSDEIDHVFRALADPTRRRLLDSLNERSGQTLRELCEGVDMARQSVSKHLGVLEAATLVSTVWRGREKLHYLNPAPISEISERWINHYDQQRVRALSDLKRALEDNPMQTPSFVYTTYIRTTPERLWQALTDPAFTERYWGVAFESDWQTGSTYTFHQDGVTIADPEQAVVEADPYRRLSYTWHTFTPEWCETIGTRVGFTDEFLAKFREEARSTVTFEIDDMGDQVKLSVVHDHFEPDSLVLGTVSQGWPRVLANLKTLLETGEPLPDISGRSRAETAQAA
jgi:uncharacterized protein YndB with AHSA1/START domain/DNA-binding transcriptional ArsR family regulator